MVSLAMVSSKRNVTAAWRPKMLLRHQKGNGNVDSACDRPRERLHRLVADADHGAVHGDGSDRPTGGCDNRERAAAEGMQCAPGQHGFDNLLHEEREHERHPDLVHRERESVGELVVALRGGVGPDQGQPDAQRHHQIVLDRIAKQADHRFGPRRMTPLSTVAPVREMVSKNISDPATSTSMKLWSSSNAAAVIADRRTSPLRSCPADPETKY